MAFSACRSPTRGSREGRSGSARSPARDLDNEYAFSIFPREGATFARGPVLVGGYGALVQRLEGASAFTTVVNDGSPADNVFAMTELPDGTLLTASQTEGIQRSEDGGATFRLSNDGIEPWLTLLGVLTDMRAITHDPSRPNLVLAGGAGGGVWRSEDLRARRRGHHGAGGVVLPASLLRPRPRGRNLRQRRRARLERVERRLALARGRWRRRD
jgi:hypothetical protein